MLEDLLMCVAAVSVLLWLAWARVPAMIEMVSAADNGSVVNGALVFMFSPVSE